MKAKNKGEGQKIINGKSKRVQMFRKARRENEMASTSHARALSTLCYRDHGPDRATRPEDLDLVPTNQMYLWDPGVSPVQAYLIHTTSEAQLEEGAAVDWGGGVMADAYVVIGSLRGRIDASVYWTRDAN